MIRKDLSLSLTDAQYDSLLHAITATIEQWHELGMPNSAVSGLRRAGMALVDGWEKAPQKMSPAKKRYPKKAS
jgi:hypothetical protein